MKTDPFPRNRHFHHSTFNGNVVVDDRPSIEAVGLSKNNKTAWIIVSTNGHYFGGKVSKSLVQRILKYSR